MSKVSNEAAPPFDPEQHPARVNLGCGWDKREGYLNVDLHAFHEPDLVADVRALDMLPTGRYDEVLAQDVLEHLKRDEALPALQEWARILRPGGRLVVRVTNLIGLFGLLMEQTEVDQQRQLVQCLFGTQAYDGDFHLNGYTELLLRADLHEAGFRVEDVGLVDEWLFDVVAVRDDDAPRPTIADCRFMQPRPSGAGAGARDLSEVRAALDRAAAVGSLGPEFVTDTRFRGPKRALLRVLRLVTHRQEQHNAAVVDAVRALTDELDRR